MDEGFQENSGERDGSGKKRYASFVECNATVARRIPRSILKNAAIVR